MILDTTDINKIKPSVAIISIAIILGVLAPSYIFIYSINKALFISLDSFKLILLSTGLSGIIFIPFCLTIYVSNSYKDDYAIEIKKFNYKNEEKELTKNEIENNQIEFTLFYSSFITTILFASMILQILLFDSSIYECIALIISFKITFIILNTLEINILKRKLKKLSKSNNKENIKNEPTT